jgi:anti-sigma B factor antagonist
MSKPPLTVTVKQAGRVCVVSVSGELDIATAPALAEQIAALPGGIERLIMDLSGLQFIDCCGARLLAGVTSAVPPGCMVVVRGATGQVRKVLDILGVLLQQRVQMALDRAEWLVLESQVQQSWAQQALADGKKLVAASRTARECRARPEGMPARARLAALRSRLTGDHFEHRS